MTQTIKCDREIAIIGPGRVGLALGLCLEQAGRRVAVIGARSPQRAREAAHCFHHPPAPMTIEAAAAAADIALLTVPDDAIAALAGRLATERGIREGSTWIHCSGALPASAMEPLQARGCHLGSMHPLHTFAGRGPTLPCLEGTLFACEGDPSAVRTARMLARAVGGSPVEITPDGKMLYHAAAVVACNGLIALFETALQLGERSGLARKDLLPGLTHIVDATLGNIASSGTEAALTGPVSRGEAKLIEQQIAALRALDDPQALELYLSFNRTLLEIARHSGRRAPDQLDAMARLLHQA